MRRLFRIAIAAAPIAAALLLATSALAQHPSGARAPLDEKRAHALVDAVVRVDTEALPDARSNETLGRTRTGSGIVIDARGRILTIGYLVIEAQSVRVTTAAQRTLPARVAAYDHATGFALLQPLGALGVRPLALGSSAALKIEDVVMTLPFGGAGAAGLVRLLAKREFTGSWEYLLEEALFTSPPTREWAGAALVNRELQLVGVGSLLVRDVDPDGDQDEVPGNMFVPIDILKPILADLIKRGKRSGPARPWMGLSTEEYLGNLVVTRVAPDGPADKAGLQRGDVVLAVGATSVDTQADLYRTVWKLGAAGVQVPLRVARGPLALEVTLKSIDRSAFFRDPVRQ